MQKVCRIQWFKRLAPVSVAVWDDEMVVYHHQSGDTHLFSDTAKHVVALCLSRERFSVPELIEAESNFFNDPQQAQYFIASIVQNLVQKDLIVAEAL